MTWTEPWGSPETSSVFCMFTSDPERLAVTRPRFKNVNITQAAGIKEKTNQVWVSHVWICRIKCDLRTDCPHPQFGTLNLTSASFSVHWFISRLWSFPPFTHISVSTTADMKTCILQSQQSWRDVLFFICSRIYEAWLPAPRSTLQIVLHQAKQSSHGAKHQMLTWEV